MSKTAYMRGLQNFISEIRGAQNKEQEQRRVEKELAKIREKFGDDKSLSGYDRRKYVWKLLYIYMLGYDIEFGHKQAADLIPQPKYKDKQVGYMACSLLLQENDEFLRLAINAIHNDLTSRVEAFECLALSFIGNVGGSEMAEALTQDVVKLLSSGAARPVVKKRAALALLRLIRKTPAEQQVVTADTFAPVINSLLDERDLGLLLSAATLLQGICARNGPAGYEGAQGRLIKILERLVINREKEVAPEYLFYVIPSPWLQCKCLRVLQFYSAPESPQERSLLNTILANIIETLGNSDAAKAANANKANAMYSILFEAISLGLHLDSDRKLLTTCVATLGKFLVVKEQPNVKYLALETLSRLALVPEVLEAIRHHQGTVIASLRDPDVSIRKRATDLLFTMCDASNAVEVVDELIKYLIIADFSMREELVLKIAILAEKFAPSVQWYVDVALQLLEKAGDFVSEEIWHRVVQLVTNNASMQQYAARNVVEVLKRGAAHESLVCTAAYILGEFGRLIVAEVPPAEQFRLLHSVFPPASQTTKGLLMTAFIKIYLLDPQNQTLRRDVVGLFERFQKFMDAELQQRAVEYMRLANSPQAAAQHYLLPMPRWQERESSLLRRLQQHEGVDPDAVPSMGRAASTASEGVTSPRGDASSAVADGGRPRLIVGGPVASPQPSMDLLGEATSTGGAGAAAPAQAPAVPPKPANPVDLLADLLSDLPSPAAAPAPAPAAPAAPLYGAPAAMAQPGMAMPNPAAMQPQPALAAPGMPAPAYGLQQPPVAAYGAAPVQPYPAAPSQLPVAAAAPAPGLVPTASFGAAQGAFGVPAATGLYEPARPIGDVSQWYNSLLIKERGILYEDQYLQVGVQCRYARSTGTVVLFLGNKNAEQAIANISLVAPSTQALSVAVSPLPAQLLPKQQVQVPIQVTALAPFQDPAPLHLAYVLANVSVAQELRLPIAPHRFIVPDAQISKELFFEQWKVNSMVPNKSQEMLERASPLASQSVVSILKLFNLGAEHGYLDPSPYNEAGAGYFMYGPPGSEQSTLVMARVEGNPQTMSQFRVTVSSPAPQLSAHVKAMLIVQLRAAAA